MLYCGKKENSFRERDRRMKLNILFPAVFFFILSLSSLSNVSCKDPKPDFFFFTLKWPGSICNTKEGCCYNENSKPAKDFIIIEMRPYYFNGTWPENCNPRSRFDLSKIKDLVPTLRGHWPSLDCPASKSEKFWSREWQKYGTCSHMNLHQYFDKALKLKQKANFFKRLTDANIQPDGRSYDAESVLKALDLVGFGCNQDKHGNFQLSTIIVCSNPDATDFQVCPAELLGYCNATVRFPPF